MTCIYDSKDVASVSSQPGDYKRSGQPHSAPTGTCPSSLIQPVSFTVTPADSKSRSANRQYIWSAVNVLFTALEVFGMTRRADSKQIRESFDHTVDRWTGQSELIGENAWMKYVKWKFSAYVHARTHQLESPPPPPKGVTDLAKHIACGIAGRYANRLARSEKGPEFIQTLLVCKKGVDRPNEVQLKEALSTTFRKLTSVPSIPQPGLVRLELGTDNNGPRSLYVEGKRGEQLYNSSRLDGHWTAVTKSNFEFQLRRTVRELFEGKSFEAFVGGRSPLYLPSTSSSFLSSRVKGGSFSDLHKAAQAFGLVDEKEKGVSFHTDEESINLFGQSFEAKIDLVKNKYANLARRLRGAYVHGGESVDMKINSVKLVALAEACKTRVISKGNAYRNFLLQPVQKFMWSTLKDHKTFRLIGEEVTADIVQEAMGRNIKEGLALLSGDYSDATNSLAPWASEMVADELAKVSGMDNVTQRLFIEALTGHDIEDPDDKKSSKKQLWGQLMGSIVSFPILCIINACVCRWAIEVDRDRKVLLRDCSLLINGDDCLLKVTSVGLAAWKKISSFVGLEPSIGKYFYTNEFAQINSMNFSYTHRDEGLCYKETAFVNMGLYFGLARSEEDDDDNINIKGIGLNHRCQELIDKCPASIRERVMNGFLNLHGKTLRELYGNIPWFLPEEYGGLGLPIFTKHEISGTYGIAEGEWKHVWEPTKLDLMCCHLMQNDRPAKLALPAQWRLRQAAMKYIPYREQLSEVEDQSTVDLIQFVTCDLIFSSPMGVIMKSMKKGANEKEYMKKVYKLRKKWTKYTNSKLPKPLSLATVLDTRPTYTYFPVTLMDRGELYDKEQQKHAEFIFRSLPELERIEKYMEDLWE